MTERGPKGLPELRNLAVLALSLALSLFAGEKILRRFVGLTPRRLEPEVRYDPHPVRRFTLHPNQQAHSYGAAVEIDDRGFRVNRSGEHRRAESGPTIFALGDSFTFGLGVRDDETWPARLEQLLRSRTGQPLIVVNGGTISYGVFQEFDLLRQAGLSTRPQLVVHGLYWNDFMSAYPPKIDDRPVVTADGYLTWDVPTHSAGGWRRAAEWLSRHSAILSLAHRALVDARPDQGTRAYAQAYARFLERGLSADEWEPVESFYADLRQLGREHAFDICVVIMPVSDALASNGGGHLYSVEAQRRLSRLGIPSLDGFAVTRAGGGRRLFLNQGRDAHLNAEGYRVLAERLAAALLAEPTLRARLD